MVAEAIIEVVSRCRKEGYALVGLSGRVADDLAWLESLLFAFGRPIHVFRRYPFWKPLAADPTRPPGRSGGIGLNSLHIDCVNAEAPPDFVCLYCVRPDPLGGGTTLLAPLDGIAQYLTVKSLATLRASVFRDGTVCDLDYVGNDINPFAVHASDGWRWRYTGRLLETGAVPTNTEGYAALLEFDRIMMSRCTGINLKAGQAVVVDQRRALHGRLPLSLGQADVPAAQRRLLLQAYSRDERR